MALVVAGMPVFRTWSKEPVQVTVTVGAGVTVGTGVPGLPQIGSCPATLGLWVKGRIFH